MGVAIPTRESLEGCDRFDDYRDNSHLTSHNSIRILFQSGDGEMALRSRSTFSQLRFYI